MSKIKQHKDHSQLIKHIGILIVFFCLTFNGLHAQDRLQEIRNKITSAPNDSTKAEGYIDLSFEYFFYSLDSLSKAIEAADKSIEIAKHIDQDQIIITAYNLRSRAYREMGEYEKSVSEMRKAITLAKEHNYKKKQYQLEDNLANTLFDQGKKDEALKLKLGAYKAFKEMNDTTSELTALFGIAYIYMETGELEKAKTELLHCTKIAPSAPAQIEVDGNLGIIYERQNKLDSALYYLERAGKKGKDYPSFVLQNEVIMAEVYHKKGDIQKALGMLLKIEDTYEENSEERDFQFYKLLIAKYQTELKDWEKAEEYINGIDTNIILNLNRYKKAYGLAGTSIYKEKGDYKKAFRFYTYYRDAVDSMENTRRDSSFRVIESKYQLGQQVVKINQQKLNNRNLSLGLLGTITLLAVGGLLFVGYRRKTTYRKKLDDEKHQKQIVEIENLKKEVKIISMQSMIEGQEEERKRIAGDLHDNIGTLMTSIKMKVLAIQREGENFDKMNIVKELDGMIDNASQQVRRISYSMTPIALDISGLGDAIKDLGQQLTENDISFKANLVVLETIKDKNLSINIYRIFQELIQNIIKHSQATEVSLDTSKRDNNLIIRIRDNGIGISKEGWEEPKSIGVKNIKSRVNYLNGEIKLIADSGTHFKISIPTNH